MVKWAGPVRRCTVVDGWTVGLYYAGELRIFEEQARSEGAKVMRTQKFLLALYFLFFPLISSCSGPAKKENITGDKSARVHVVTVEAKQQTAADRILGSVRPKKQASIEAKVSGKITAIKVTQGQHVTEGDAICDLGGKEITAKLDQAQASLDQAEKDLKRFTTLLQSHAVTQAEFDAVSARAKIARAGVEEAQTMSEYTRIVAPFTGVITKKLVDVGDLATPGKALIEMEDPTTLRFEANIPESLIRGIALGQTMTVEISGEQNSISGTVAEIAPVVDPNSRTSLVAFDLPESMNLRSGQFGHVLVPTSNEEMIYVPRTAIVLRGQLEIAYVIADGRAQLRLVRTGKIAGDQVQILSGLSNGEKIVVDTVSPLHDGQAVEVVP